MNSSGIKRGLAAGAISALAVTGLPFLASSANAATGDVIKVASVGPALNGDGPGAQILVQVTAGSVANATDLKVIGSDLSSPPNTPTQTVVAGTPVAVTTDSNPKDGLDEYIVPVTVTTPSAGDTAKFAIYNDEDATAGVQAADPRVQASVTTSGPVKSIDLSPSSQTTSTGQDSGLYTATIKDGAGRVTQLASADTLDVSATNGSVPSSTSISATDIALGTYDFTVNGGTAGKQTVTVADHADNTIKDTATLQVAPAAVLDKDNINAVTGADSWSDFGDNDGGTTLVRVDQSSMRLDFQGTTANPNKDGNVVVLTVSNKAGNVSFDGGEASTTVTTTLDANGVGSLTIIPDAGSIRENDVITVTDGTFTQDFKFVKAAATSIESTSPYFGAFGGSVTVDATVLDQFGLPATGGYVTAARSGANPDTSAPQKQAVGSDGKVSFTFADTKAKDALTKSDTVLFTYFADQYTTTPGPTKSVTINWTADGKGADFGTVLNGSDTEATTYDPAKNSIVPLSDAVADDDSGDDESAALAVTGAENDQPITVTVDNGALILDTSNGDDKLSQGVSSIDAVTDSTGALSGYEIVGTKSGLVTVTISSANRTETAQFTVAAQTDADAARNVTVSGPAEVEHGTTQIPFTAVVTDAFGNPVPNVSMYNLNIQVSGPGQYQDGGVVTNDAGQLQLNVRVDADAAGPVSIQVTGLPDTVTSWQQFGAAADHIYATSASKDGEGLTASSNVATATTTVKAAEVVVPQEPEDIQLALSGHNNGRRDDVLKADATRAAKGLTANLYRKTRHGLKKVASATLNRRGNHRFKVADRNGRRATTYVVKVAKTDTTTRGYDRERVR